MPKLLIAKKVSPGLRRRLNKHQAAVIKLNETYLQLVEEVKRETRLTDDGWNRVTYRYDTGEAIQVNLEEKGDIYYDLFGDLEGDHSSISLIAPHEIVKIDEAGAYRIEADGDEYKQVAKMNGALTLHPEGIYRVKGIVLLNLLDLIHAEGKQ